jgi:hypothetical protein
MGVNTATKLLIAMCLNSNDWGLEKLPTVIKAIFIKRFVALIDQIQESSMTVKTIAKVKPAFPFEAYSHVVSPIDAAVGGGFMFTMPDIPGVLADGATELDAIADGREALCAPFS